MAELTTLSDRLQMARKKAGFSDASEAARAYGWNENTYRSHENGARGIRAPAAAKYASAFRVSTVWLLLGIGSADDSRTARWVGDVGDGGEVTTLGDNTDGYVGLAELDFAVPPITAYYQIATKNAYPRYADGDILLIWDSQTVEQNWLFGPEFEALSELEAVVFDPQGNAYLGTLVRHSKSIIVHPLGTKPIFDFSVARFEPIRAVVRRGMHRVSFVKIAKAPRTR